MKLNLTASVSTHCFVLYRCRVLYRRVRIDIRIRRRTRNKNDTAYGQITRVYHHLHSRVLPNRTQATTWIYCSGLPCVVLHKPANVCQIAEIMLFQAGNTDPPSYSDWAVSLLCDPINTHFKVSNSVNSHTKIGAVSRPPFTLKIHRQHVPATKLFPTDFAL